MRTLPQVLVVLALALAACQQDPYHIQRLSDGAPVSDGWPDAAIGLAARLLG